MSDLEDLLNDVEETEEVEAEAQPEAEATAKAEAETESETEKVETEKSEEVETTAAKESEEEESWTKAAVLDERRKRQELERKLAEYEKAKPERPDVFEDQDGAFGHVKDELRSEIGNIKLELSQDMMRSIHEDYDELESEFIELAKDNAALLTELNQAKNPARFAYETAKKARQAAELKDVEGMRAKIEAEMRAEIEAKLKAEAEESAKKKSGKDQALSPSLAASTSTGGVDNFEDDSLEAILS